MEEMCNRFEIPNPRNKWDRPLFTLTEKDITPLEEIKNILIDNSNIPNRNPATEYVNIIFLMLTHIK